MNNWTDYDEFVMGGVRADVLEACITVLMLKGLTQTSVDIQRALSERYDVETSLSNIEDCMEVIAFNERQGDDLVLQSEQYYEGH